MSNGINEKNFKAGAVAIGVAFITLATGVTVGVVNDGNNKVEVAKTCIQAGGEWREPLQDCVRR